MLCPACICSHGSQLAAAVMWPVMGLWMCDEVGSGGQQGGVTHLRTLVSWSAAHAHAPNIIIVFESMRSIKI